MDPRPEKLPYEKKRAEEACRALSPRVDGDIPGGDEARSGGSIPSLPTHAPSGRLLSLLPALLRSPFRLRDKLTRSSDPQIEIALFFREWSPAGTRPTPPRDFKVKRGRGYGATTSLVWLKIPYDKSEST